jgi:hypothetical protein
VTIPPEVQAPSAPAVSEFGEEAFKAAVRRAKQYIVDGDIMQVVLSQRMSKPFAASPLALYRALRTLNPSPYMFYFNFEDFHVVGASPEILVRLEHQDGERRVTVRPIAGTRKRGATLAEDEALAADLLADPKERAEHLMLLDLGRNDIGRVAKTGTVKVSDPFIIERYSHVMHIVSNVDAELKDDEGALGVLKATFPAGTVSGAPKVRAMEIIDELEPSKRGIYAGSVGVSGLQRRHGPLHRDPHRGDQGRPDPRPGRRRHRRRFRPRFGMAGNAEQGAGAVARRRDGRSRPRHAFRLTGGCHAIDDRQLRQLHLQPGAVFRRTRRGRQGVPQRCDHPQGNRRDEAGPHRGLARSLLAGRGRHLGGERSRSSPARSRCSASASATRASARPSAARSCMPSS